MRRKRSYLFLNVGLTLIACSLVALLLVILNKPIGYLSFDQVFAQSPKKAPPPPTTLKGVLESIENEVGQRQRAFDDGVAVETEAQRRMDKDIAVREQAESQASYEHAVNERIEHDLEYQLKLHSLEDGIRYLRAYIGGKIDQDQQFARMEAFIKMNRTKDKFKWLMIKLDDLPSFTWSHESARAELIEKAYGDDPKFKAIFNAD